MEIKRKLLLLLSLFCFLCSYAQDYGRIFNTEFKDAMMLQKNGAYNAAHKKIENLAKQGFPLAQIELARDFDSGMGCVVDFSEAYKWMYKAAYNTTWMKVPLPLQKWRGDAYFYLGMYSMEGMGTIKDLKMAVKYWEKGSEYASIYQANCFLQLAFSYEKGWGSLTKDLKKARELYKKASDLGDPDAPYYLGVYYGNGIGGVSQNDANAFYYIKLSAERGYAAGQSLLGEIYDNGYFGQKKNESLAIEWWKKAAKQGYSTAIGYLTELGVTW